MTALLEYIDLFIKVGFFQSKFSQKPAQPLPFRPYPFLWPCILLLLSTTDAAIATHNNVLAVEERWVSACRRMMR